MHTLSTYTTLLISLLAVCSCNSPKQSPKSQNIPTTPHVHHPLQKSLQVHAQYCVSRAQPCTIPPRLRKSIEVVQGYARTHTFLHTLQNSPPEERPFIARAGLTLPILPAHDTSTPLLRALLTSPQPLQIDVARLLARILFARPYTSTICADAARCTDVLPHALEQNAEIAFKHLKGFSTSAQPHILRAALRVPSQSSLSKPLKQQACAWFQEHLTHPNAHVHRRAIRELHSCSPETLDSTLNELHRRVKSNGLSIQYVREIGHITRKTPKRPAYNARAKRLLRDIASSPRTPVRIRAEALWNVVRLYTPPSDEEKAWIESFQGHERPPLRDAAARSIAFLRDNEKPSIPTTTVPSP